MRARPPYTFRLSSRLSHALNNRRRRSTPVRHQRSTRTISGSSRKAPTSSLTADCDISRDSALGAGNARRGSPVQPPSGRSPCRRDLVNASANVRCCPIRDRPTVGRPRRVRPAAEKSQPRPVALDCDEGGPLRQGAGRAARSVAIATSCLNLISDSSSASLRSGRLRHLGRPLARLRGRPARAPAPAVS
jgi:hypothetical protein